MAGYFHYLVTTTKTWFSLQPLSVEVVMSETCQVDGKEEAPPLTEIRGNCSSVELCSNANALTNYIPASNQPRGGHKPRQPTAVTSEGLRLRSEGASCVSTNSTASHLFFLFWIGIELMTLCLRGRRNATELNPWHPPTQSPIWRKTRPEDLGRTTQASPRVLSREETSHIHREPSLQRPQTRGAKKPRHI